MVAAVSPQLCFAIDTVTFLLSAALIGCLSETSTAHGYAQVLSNDAAAGRDTAGDSNLNSGGVIVAEPVDANEEAGLELDTNVTTFGGSAHGDEESTTTKHVPKSGFVAGVVYAWRRPRVMTQMLFLPSAAFLWGLGRLRTFAWDLSLENCRLDCVSREKLSSAWDLSFRNFHMRSFA